MLCNPRIAGNTPFTKRQQKYFFRKFSSGKRAPPGHSSSRKHENETNWGRASNELNSLIMGV